MAEKLKFVGIIIFCLICLSNAVAAIRVVAYNCENHPNNTQQEGWFRTIFEAIGNESVNGIQKRLDVLVMSEMDESSAIQLVSILNSLYNVNTYASELSSSYGGDRTGVIYDRESLAIVGTPADLTNIGQHPILRVHFRPVGSTDANEEFYVYCIHFKSGSSSSVKTIRTTEAANLRNDADALGQNAHIIYAGDFNITGSSEGAWINLLAPGNGQAFDPANAPGEWRDDTAFRHLHSQDPGARMDDRFDFQFLTSEFTDGAGIDYVPNSFRVFGNNGTHILDNAITTGTANTPDVLNALASVSDHLPVVADYDIGGVPPESLKQRIRERITQIEQELAQLRSLVNQLPD